MAMALEFQLLYFLDPGGNSEGKKRVPPSVGFVGSLTHYIRTNRNKKPLTVLSPLITRLSHHLSSIAMGQDPSGSICYIGNYCLVWISRHEEHLPQAFGYYTSSCGEVLGMYLVPQLRKLWG